MYLGAARPEHSFDGTVNFLMGRPQSQIDGTRSLASTAGIAASRSEGIVPHQESFLGALQRRTAHVPRRWWVQHKHQLVAVI